VYHTRETGGIISVYEI